MTEEGAVDREYARAVAAFVLRAPRRRPALTVFLFLAFGAAALAAARSISPMYRAELQLIAQPASADESRKLDPVKYAIDVARSRDTLARAVDDADLVARSERARPWTLRTKDRISAWLGGPRPVDARAAAIGSLRTRLSIAQEGTSVVIDVMWTDPQGAVDAAELEREAFLRAVYDAYVKVAMERQEVADEAARKAFANLQDALRAYADDSMPRSEVAAPGLTVTLPATRTPGLAEEVAEKEQQARDVEGRWRAALGQRNDALTEALSKYTRSHPLVIQLQGEVDSLSQPPNELVSLRQELSGLRERLEQEVRPPTPTPSPAQRVRVETPVDGQTLLARSKLDAAMRSYEATEEAADREGVLVEVTRRQARDRFRIGTPAEVPDKPVRPTALIATVAALPSAAFLALLVASLRDLARGNFVESWQVRRRLGIDPLAELEVRAPGTDR
jgi:hypothetical protein